MFAEDPRCRDVLIVGFDKTSSIFIFLHNLPQTIIIVSDAQLRLRPLRCLRSRNSGAGILGFDKTIFIAECLKLPLGDVAHQRRLLRPVWLVWHTYLSAVCLSHAWQSGMRDRLVRSRAGALAGH